MPSRGRMFFLQTQETPRWLNAMQTKAKRAKEMEGVKHLGRQEDDRRGIVREWWEEGMMANTRQQMVERRCQLTLWTSRKVTGARLVLGLGERAYGMRQSRWPQ